MDQRVVRLKITAKGERILSQLVGATVDELSRSGGQLEKLWKGIDSPPSYASKGLRTAPTQAKAKKTTAKKTAANKRPAAKRTAKKAASRRR